jgi:hypothetical protein
MKNRLTIRSTLIAAALSLSLSTFASAADYHSEEFESAYNNYLQVTDEAGGSAKNLAKQWQALHDADPKDPLTMVMLGSSHTLMGRDAFMPWSKMKHTEAGLDEMAMAQRLLNDSNANVQFQHMPVYLHVKSTAGITFTQVPEFFGRHEEGFYLLEEVIEDPGFRMLPAQAKTYMYFFAINSAYQIDKSVIANEWLEELNNLGVEDEYTRAANELGD